MRNKLLRGRSTISERIFDHLPRCIFAIASAVLILCSAATASAQQQRFDGTLQQGDATFSDGEFKDIYEFNIQAGQTLGAALASNQFDTYLIIQSPSGETTVNDDAEEGNSNLSRASVVASESGAWQVIVTTYKPGERGSYALTVNTGNAPAPLPADAAPAGSRIEHGTLTNTDMKIDSGEYTDVYKFSGQAGEHYTIDLRSSDFDTYLICQCPDGETSFDNDDHDGDESRSQIALELPQTGEYRVLVTTYKPELVGEYQLSIQKAGDNRNNGQQHAGRLTPDDIKLRTGEFVDEYSFEGRPGMEAFIDLTSNEFDTYLIVMSPGGERFENDDSSDEKHSQLRINVTESGTYVVGATTYEPGETGAYDLTIKLENGQPSSPQRDVLEIAYGEIVEGTLQEGDAQFDDGEYKDIFVFEGRKGDTVRVEMASDQLDTFLVLTNPDNTKIRNDDFDSDTSSSRIEFELPETGRYRVAATSYAAKETGNYRFAVSRVEGANIADLFRDNHGRLIGIFVGISDYQGNENDLDYTADDAVRVRDAFVEHCGMHMEHSLVLTDEKAKRENLVNAIKSVSDTAGPDDTFVFFYSGHGSRVQRSENQPADPDGFDETLVLYDEQVLDDEFNLMLDSINAGVQLVVLDSCFSGGFSKDIISTPGRMGIFSSEEDVTSSVAGKFRAGGYLAKFFSDALEVDTADGDRDGAISAIELSHYIQEQYRSEVKGGGPDEIVSTSSRQLGYQKVVVDRGSIGPYTPLFFRK